MKQLAWLEIWYRHWRLQKLTAMFNQKFGMHKTKAQIRAALRNHKFTCGRPCGNAIGSYRLLTRKQAAFIRRHIVKYSNKELVKRLNNTFSTDFSEKQIKTFRQNHKIKSGRTGQFQKGHKSWNKGSKGLTPANSGMFGKGHVPANIKPIGHTRIDAKDGYILMKVNEKDPHTGSATRYKAKHVVLWESRNGPVPKGCVIIFRDCNIRNFNSNNLVCITRSELARLNQMKYRQYPLKLKPSVFALAKLKTKIGDRNKNK